MSSPSLPSEDTPEVPDSLSYLLQPQYPSVTDLLNLTMTEIIAPPRNLLSPRLSKTTSTSNIDMYHHSPENKSAREIEGSCSRVRRCLFSNEVCCCMSDIPAGHTSEEHWSGWERNQSTVSLPSSHCVIQLSPKTKTGSSTCISKSNNKLHNTTSSLTKSSSTGRVDAFVKYIRGYPYQKEIIPFHFQHLESNMASTYIDSYRRSHTYPNMEDKLKSSDSSAGPASFSAPSVIEPKLLVLGISKPGASELYSPHYNRQTHKLYSTQNAPMRVPNTKSSTVYENLSRQRNAVEIDTSHSQLYHPSVTDLASKCNSSANILEVFHGQTNCHQLSHLPNPETSDSESLPKRQANSFAHTQRSLRADKNRDLHLHFRDILSINDTQGFHKQARPNVTWASHKFPPNLMSPMKQDTSHSSSGSSSTVQSPGQVRQGKLVSKSLNQVCSSRHVADNKVQSSRNKSHTGEITSSLVHTRLANPELSSSSLSKLTPSTIKTIKESKGKPHIDDAGNRQGDKKIKREHLPVAPGIRKRHSGMKQDSSLTLMPTSKSLVPSLGIVSRVKLTQKPLRL